MISLDELVETLTDVWGLNGVSVELLGGEFAETYKVTTADGSRYCLKSLAPSSDVDLEISAIRHVTQAKFALAPSLVLTADQQDRHNTGQRTLFLLRWIEGQRWADRSRRGPSLLGDLGRAAAELVDALADFSHPAASRTHHWDARSADQSIEQHLDQCGSPGRRTIAEQVMGRFRRIRSTLDSVAQSVVHQDINDHNTIVDVADGSDRICGLIDFGDTLESATITELAVAVAYAMLREVEPVDAACAVVAGWCEVRPVTPVEIDAVMPLAMARLVVNATTWAARSVDQPEYAEARSKDTWAVLEHLALHQFAIIQARISEAAGIPAPVQVASTPSSESDFIANASSVTVVDLDPHRDCFDGVEPTDRNAVRAACLPSLPFAIAHDTVRLDRAAFPSSSGGLATVQRGVELGVPQGTEVRVPCSGRVIETTERIVVEHQPDEGPLWSVWTGLSSSIESAGSVEAGDLLGVAGTGSINVALLVFEPELGVEIPQYVRPADRTAWNRLSVDPGDFLGLEPAPRMTWATGEEIVADRRSHLSDSQRFYYRQPPTLVRASGTVFVDENAHLFLDCLNNVTHVGHGNHRVVEAATMQMYRLNTNSRFVYEEMARYATRLAELLPDPLNVVFLVCSGSEANDLALRISRQVTGRDDIMVIEGAYHGNTTAVTGISPNRYRGPGGEGPPPTTHEVPQPNRYRGAYGYDHADPGRAYANDAAAVVGRLVDQGRPPAAFIAESLMGTAGQIVHPPGYLAQSFAAVRSAGGLCISDEVQVGFGRLGHTFWGFEMSDVVPDIVTMGKPMGNGHPIAAVVTTKEIAEAFDQGMKYFNTFGGNPVSCAIAGAVLDEIERLDLRKQSIDVGGYLGDALRLLADKHVVIGDVRGVGLYLGVEFVADRDSKVPVAAFTTEVCERLLDRGIMMYPNGDLGNCLKIKPPMVFSKDDADRFVSALDATLAELTT